MHCVWSCWGYWIGIFWFYERLDVCERYGLWNIFYDELRDIIGFCIGEWLVLICEIFCWGSICCYWCWNLVSILVFFFLLLREWGMLIKVVGKV